jgi:hypothetical protein
METIPITTPTTLDEIQMMLDELAAADAVDRDELATLTVEVSTLARWLARHAPGSWEPLATLITDEPGHWDDSYPPDSYEAEFSDVDLRWVYGAETTERETSGGFYNSWEVVTTRPGLAIDRRGNLFAAIEGGTASTGRYAAHPGTTNRNLTTEFRAIGTPTIDQLRAAADLLRRLQTEIA